MTTPAENIAQWDGSVWSPLGVGVAGRVRDLELYAGELVAVGNFISAGGVTVRYVAKWNGASWSPLAGGVTGTHWDTVPFTAGLTTLFGKLYVTGSFIYADGYGIVIENIAAWDGSSWSALDEGIDFCCSLGSWGMEIAGVGDKVYVAGLFGSASGVPSNYIGEWTVGEVTGVPPDPPAARAPTLLSAFPNPCASGTALGYVLPERASVKLTVHDLQGRLVVTLIDEIQGPGEQAVRWTGRTRTNEIAAPGLYLGRLVHGGQVSTVKLLKLD